tara:strand:- start:611 stop:808 length:198 start_codon:yes stop_codon:yes gene_type:complete
MDIMKQFEIWMDKEQLDVKNPGAFIQGELDAINGTPHKTGCSSDYERGYSARIQIERMMEGRTSQ